MHENLVANAPLQSEVRGAHWPMESAAGHTDSRTCEPDSAVRFALLISASPHLDGATLIRFEMLDAGLYSDKRYERVCVGAALRSMLANSPGRFLASPRR
jgi:hypothetical protein